MKRISLLALLLALCTVPVFAQNYPKAEVFGGYQYLRAESADVVTAGSANFNGWDASATVNMNKWFGVEGDFSGNYKTQGVNVPLVGNLNFSLRDYTYMFGPVVKARQNERFEPFVHALFGGNHLTARGSLGPVNASVSANGYAMAVGGGVDAKVSDRLAVRLVQVDWVTLHFGDVSVPGVGTAPGATTKKNVRIATGIVFRF
jgi:opacity protein-like surface antigen